MWRGGRCGIANPFFRKGILLMRSAALRAGLRRKEEISAALLRHD
jgi:hypothetical protein